jgi:stage II sporulation protein D
MKYITFAIISIIFLFSQPALAEDTIKVLMIESPYSRLPSGDARVIDSVTGKVFINGQHYSGNLEIMKDKQGLYVINNLPFEEYIEGVVASEIGLEWEPEALKAQAVISRTYGAFYRGRNEANSFHLTSSTLHQLYKSKNTDPLITYAVKVTEGEILTYHNLPIKALFHAACAGKTEIPEELWEGSYPYLTSVDCYGRNAPYDNWQRKFSTKEISALLKTGRLKDISISSYTATGRVKTLKVLVDEKESARSAIEVKAADLRKLLGYNKLPSTYFSLAKKDGYIIFSGKGFGHGVGLSQWGALEMAKQGKNYREILSHYYPGTLLKHNDELQHKDLASATTP